jgi:hypothetical protein
MFQLLLLHLSASIGQSALSRLDTLPWLIS